MWVVQTTQVSPSVLISSKLTHVPTLPASRQIDLHYVRTMFPVTMVLEMMVPMVMTPVVTILNPMMMMMMMMKENLLTVSHVKTMLG